MFRFIGNTVASLNRNFKNVEFRFKFYSIFFVLIFFVFGVFGIVPLVKVVQAKQSLLSEMHTSVQIMETNIEMLSKAELDLMTNDGAILTLDTYMPIQTNVQDYLLQFVSAASLAGMEVKGFTQDPTSQSGKIDISVFLLGRGYPTDLVKRIEDLKRVTQVREMTVSVAPDGEISVNLALSIYTIIQ